MGGRLLKVLNYQTKIKVKKISSVGTIFGLKPRVSLIHETFFFSPLQRFKVLEMIELWHFVVQEIETKLI